MTVQRPTVWPTKPPSRSIIRLFAIHSVLTSCPTNHFLSVILSHPTATAHRNTRLPLRFVECPTPACVDTLPAPLATSVRLIVQSVVYMSLCGPGYSSSNGHRSLGGHASTGGQQQPSSMTTGHPSPSSSVSVASAAVAAVAAAVRKSCFDGSHSSASVASTAAAAAAAAASVAPWRPQGLAGDTAHAHYALHTRTYFRPSRPPVRQ